jgi:glutathione S-transferase
MPICRCSSWSRACSYAFPIAAAGACWHASPAVRQLQARVAALPRVAAYLKPASGASPFNEQGIFRRYPELDIV